MFVESLAYRFALVAIICASSIGLLYGQDSALEPRVDILGDPLPDKALLRFGTKRFQHPSGPSKLILSKDEQTVFSVDESHLIAWDATTGKELWREPMEFEGSMHVGAAGYGINTLAVTPDDQLVAPAGAGQIAFWAPGREPKQGANGNYELLRVGIVSAAKSIDVSPDGKLLAIGTNRILLVCDRNGKEVYRVLNTKQPLRAFGNDRDRLKFGGDFSYGKFSPDGMLLAMVNSTKPNSIQLFEAATGKASGVIETKDRVVRLAFSPDSRQIVATERDISARLYDIASRARIWEYVIIPDRGGESYTSDVAFRPDAKQIAVGAPIGDDYRIRLLDAKTGKETGGLSGSGWKPWTMQYRSDSRVLYASGWDGVIRRWNTETEAQIAIKGVRASSCCAMSRNGLQAAFSDDRKNVHLVDVRTGKTLKKFKKPGVGWEQLVFSHDGKLLAAGGSSDKQVHVVVWQIDDEQKLHDWDWDKGKDTHSSVEALSFSRNQERLAAAVFRQDAAYVFDLPSDLQIAKIGHRDIYGLDIDADGVTLFTAGWDKQIRVWDCDSGKVLQSSEVEEPAPNNNRLMQPDTRMYGIKLSNDESTIATVDMMATIRFYDRELNPISKIKTAGGFTYGTLQFSRNDLWFGVGVRGKVQVFDIASGTELWSAREHEEYVYTVDFGARDSSFLTGGTDGVCYLWDLSAGANREADPKQLHEDLTDWNCVKAFVAYQRLLKSPEQAVDIVATNLSQMLQRETFRAEIKKWIVALGAEDKAIVEHGIKQLTAMGPGAYDELTAAIEEPGLAAEKKSRLEEARRSLFRPLRWSVALLGAIDAPAADQALDDLLAKAQSDRVRAIIEQARRRRAQYPIR